MVDLARRNGLPWDAILGAEFARDYKPKVVVYTSAAVAFDCEPAQVLMVAAHSNDLAAAAAAGLRTAHIARPDEKGPGRGERGPSVRGRLRRARPARPRRPARDAGAIGCCKRRPHA